MTVGPGLGQTDNWLPQITQLEELSRQLQAAINHHEFDKAKRLGEERLALLSTLLDQGGVAHNFPSELVSLACQILDAEQALLLPLELEKSRLRERLSEVVTGARASSVYKKNKL